jgi:hypothetical protein
MSWQPNCCWSCSKSKNLASGCVIVSCCGRQSLIRVCNSDCTFSRWGGISLDLSVDGVTNRFWSCSSYGLFRYLYQGLLAPLWFPLWVSRLPVSAVSGACSAAVRYLCSASASQWTKRTWVVGSTAAGGDRRHSTCLKADRNFQFPYL